MADRKPGDGFVRRGERTSTPLGTALFCVLRAMDPILQRQILLSAPLASLAPKLGLSRPLPPPNGGPLIISGGLNLTPFEAVIWAMSVGSAVKQILWLLTLSKESMYPGPAALIAIFNTVNNSINTLLFTTASSNPTYVSPYSVYVGAAFYTIGILVEPIAELQRKVFKDKPENQGKAYAGGLFGLARNINYGAYTLWRGGFALAASGPVWGGICAAFFTWDFAARAVPALEDYCEKKYGEQWKRITREVPYRLFPGVY